MLSNHMGLFLQKTNIIRDYLEVRASTAACSSTDKMASWTDHACTLVCITLEQASGPGV